VVLGVAFILVLYAYGGWNDAAFVAADMRSIRDIPKALIFGTLGITFIYLLVNLATSFASATMAAPWRSRSSRATFWKKSDQKGRNYQRPWS